MRKFVNQIIIAILSMLIITAPAYADMNSYLTDTLSNLQSLSYHAYQGQERGYFVGGSARFKPPNITIQPFSVTAPHITDNGCGGIDVVMGGFSYLNFQYLVKKLQAILQAAPAFAFQLALKTYLPQVATTLSDLESISDAINSINLSSCNATKTLVSSAAGALTNIASNSKLKTTAASKQSSGQNGFFGGALASVAGPNLNTAWNKFTKDFSNGFKTKNQGTTGAGNVTSQKDLSIGIPCNGMISGLANAYDIVTPMGTADFTKFTRALLGDIIPANNSNCPLGGDTVNTIYAGSSWSFTKMGDLLNELAIGNGMPYTKNSAMIPESTAVQIRSNTYTPVKFTPIAYTVQKTITKIESDLQGTNTLSTADIAFINASSIPIFAFLKAAAITNVPAFTDALNEQLVQAVSYQIAYHDLKNIISSMFKAVSLARQSIKSAKTGAAMAQVAADEEMMQGVLSLVYHSLQTSYSIKIQKFQTTITSFEDQYKNVQGALNKIMSHNNMGSNLRLQKILNKS